MSVDTEGYELARDPDEVPTPLAIAVADFCRRAGRPSAPEAVRLALARLDPAEDEEARALAEAEPEARPLGPEAVVDILRGLPAEEAAAREDSGYYVALARAPRRPAPPLAERKPPPGAAPHVRREAERQQLLAVLAEARGDLHKAAEKLSLTDDALQAKLKRLSLVRRAQELTRELARGARPPQVRKQGEKVERTRPSAPVPPALPKRGADRPPKGRLVLGNAVQRELRELERPEGRAELRELLVTYKGSRRALLRRLNEVFASPKGKLDEDRLEALLARHNLRREAERLEVDNLRFLFTQARGDLSEVAKRMKLPVGTLRKQLEARGLWDEAERVRDRYRRELFGRPMSELVFNLLKRARYLRELEALAPLERHVREEAERAWQVASTAPAEQRAERLAARMNIAPEHAQDLVRRFRLKA